ncbi:hypothetical protein WR25_26060 [Diploscapter pachys]|uniref:Uncharacterized protein n=1 Tax=Diploscapter pachys TaxID=2018661 RepID=A0A2A2K7A5_9BILA|nr:hypothetical protein WR25_26060 [Diploscapter pachys]
MNGEIPVVVAPTIASGMGIDKANIQAKKGLSDDAKDIQIKALQTGFEKMIEDCEKKCLKNCDFCRIPEKVSQQANVLKTQRQASLYSRSQRQNGEAHEPFGYEPRQKKEEDEYSGFENGLERMEKEEATRIKTVQDEFERRRKARELANGGAARKVHRATRHCCSGRQFLPGRQPADIEYNSCYLQSKTLSSYNHKSCVIFI